MKLEDLKQAKATIRGLLDGTQDVTRVTDSLIYLAAQIQRDLDIAMKRRKRMTRISRQLHEATQ